MKIDVNHIAKLANLPLEPDEKAKFEKQLEETVDYISQLNEIDTEKVKPTNHVTNLKNVLRKDQAAPSLSQEEALKNAKSVHNGLFKVPAILEE